MTSDAIRQNVGFEEKPLLPKSIPGTSECLAAMGVYLLDADGLLRSVAGDLLDFGRDVIPALVRQGEPVFASDFKERNRFPEYEYAPFDGVRKTDLVPVASDCTYWRDVGTLEEYWQANLDRIKPVPEFNVYGPCFPVFSSTDNSPPGKFVHEEPGRTGTALSSIVADGTDYIVVVPKDAVL